MARRRMRMAELVRESNVPRETIHFYLREGLLPPPEKAGRTLAYYDDAHLERLRFVRHLRDEKYLPIPVIRSILNAGLSGSRSRDALTLADVLSIDPAIGRMEAPTPDDETLRVGDLVLDGASREVTRGGEPIALTSTEFELLRYLMRNPKRALTRAEILDRVWNYSFGGRSSIVDLYISYLRRKIDDGREPMIHTVRGVGYMVRPPQ